MSVIHTLHARLDDFREDMLYSVSCASVDDECASYQECGCDLDGNDDDEPCPKVPGQFHRYMGGMMCTPTSHCFVQHHDHLGDAAQYLGIAVDGDYLVKFHVEDFYDLELSLVYPEEV